MTIYQLIEAVMAAVGQWWVEHPLRAAAVVVMVLIGSTVTVKRLELPVYRWARDWVNRRLDSLGGRLNAGLARDVSGLAETVAQQSQLLTVLTQELQAQKVTADRRQADEYSREILRFNRKIMEGGAPDRESYVEALAVIDLYNDYCREHPEYPNCRAEAAVENIRTHYQHRLKVGFCKEATSWTTS